jgi:hypothetical protein
MRSETKEVWKKRLRKPEAKRGTKRKSSSGGNKLRVAATASSVPVVDPEI